MHAMHQQTRMADYCTDCNISTSLFSPLTRVAAHCRNNVTPLFVSSVNGHAWLHATCILMFLLQERRILNQITGICSQQTCLAANCSVISTSLLSQQTCMAAHCSVISTSTLSQQTCLAAHCSVISTSILSQQTCMAAHCCNNDLL